MVDAARLVATVRTYDPGHVDLPDTLARLMEEARLDDEGLARLLAGEAQAVRADPRDAAAAAGGGAGIDAGERARRIHTLRAQADAAQSAGNLVDATGSGAADRVAAARVLDPASADVAAAALRLLPLVRECHVVALRGNSLRRAGMCLEAREALGDDTGELSMARRQLAERWLAVGDERLGAGEIANARSAWPGAGADTQLPASRLELRGARPRPRTDG